ncbi:hypothetical protein AWB80_08158 [Caballeronia pedi]|uniref:Uncharacterized protein n=1 Tax=Caballeronia pedi TaxID=1777141 RepID=A0A158E4C7_9BURK|nr:hypothetical protein [Caballeronia pedi]SAL01580.1 hypothetical protein AWB80_08158 [Caballeronia pedi]
MKSLSTKAQRKLGNWLLSGDTGVSSETMAAIALGATSLGGKHHYRGDAPHDPSDFGRCYRLVINVPEIREFFPRIAKKVKPFAGILREWDDLVRIYERDKPMGRSDELCRRIQELRGEKA